MSDFAFYFETGWQHIISWDALDHLLFVVALAAIYLLPNWKHVLILVTAFTIGHSLTLALSVLDIIRINEKWVEFLIPCTIVITAFLNFAIKDFAPRSLRLNYFLALFFGLVHGMGFANTIRFMLVKGQNIALPLISFNLGLEAGQIAVVALILLLSYIVVNKLKLPRKWWVWGLSFTAILIGLNMVRERWP
ncbi:MAG: HupE/UreJ family protein [Aquabacterium sp.]|nr:HupE/UreJ family protein [Ferruginibacter sp.]